MTRTDKTNLRILLSAAALFLAAYFCRFAGALGLHPTVFGILRSFFYVCLYMLWGTTVRRRIIQREARRYLTAIAALMIFWFMIRTLKYNFISETVFPDVARFIWYLYYLPMLFIPLLALFTAFFLGQPQDSRLSLPARLAYIPFVLALLLVLTNDLHQLVFIFPEGSAVRTDAAYSYAFCYYIIVALPILCALTMLAVMCLKCRLPGSRRRIILPCIPIMMLLFYLASYYLHAPWVKPIAGDLTAATCLLYAATLEICIQCGFIQANTHYEELFTSAKYLKAQITDDSYNVRYSSRGAESIPEELMHASLCAPIMLSNGEQLHNMPIHGGHVIWTQDISELAALKEQLEEAREELKERNALLQYEYDRESEHRALEEQDRLFDLLQSKTQTQIDKIGALVDSISGADGDRSKKNILARIAVLGSYIKRRKDLVLSIDSTPVLPEGKLKSALAESCRALELMGVRTSFLVSTGREYLSGELLADAYDFFEDAVEACLDSLSSISVRVLPVCGRLRISLFVDAQADFSALISKYPSALIELDEDGAFLANILEGGDAS